MTENERIEAVMKRIAAETEYVPPDPPLTDEKVKANWREMIDYEGSDPAKVWLKGMMETMIRTKGNPNESFVSRIADKGHERDK